MSVSRKPSHPLNAHGMIEILEELPPNVGVGSQFGYFACIGAISLAGPTGINPCDVALRVLANTSQSHALTAGRIYMASFRLIKREDDETFTGYYTPKQPRKLPTSDDAPDMTNEVTTSGLGIVVSREETHSEDTGEAMLITSIHHSDWDSEARKVISFDVTYAVMKKGTLSNVFGLFQLGREVYLTGLIVDWDESKKNWIVETLTVSMMSGHQTLKGLGKPTPSSRPGESGRKGKLLGYSAIASGGKRLFSFSLTSTSSMASHSPTKSSHQVDEHPPDLSLRNNDTGDALPPGSQGTAMGS